MAATKTAAIGKPPPMRESGADLVTQDEVDIGFSFDPGGRSNLREFFGIDLPLGAIMAKDHPLAGTSKLSLAQCLEHDLILPSPTLSIRDIIDARCKRGSGNRALA